MFRFFIRLGVVALLVVAFSHPVQALPLGAEEREGAFSVSLSEIWSWLIAPFAGDGGVVVPPLEPGDPLQGRGTCDPNGGPCPEPDNNG